MRQLNIKNSKDIYSVQLAVDEACTNIIQHAYSNKSTGRILIQCMLSSDNNQFTVTITDWGKSYDPRIVPTPNTEGNLNERKEGGLGLFLINKFMDSVKYTSAQNMNKLVMAKTFKKDAERRSEKIRKQKQ